MNVFTPQYKRSVLRTSILGLCPKGTILLVCLFVAQQPLKLKADGVYIRNEEPHHCFLKQNAIMLGLGYGQSLAHSSNGVNARAYYNIHERFCFGPEIAFRQASSLRSTDINLVAHYIIDIRHFGFYPIAGASYTREESHGLRKEGLGGVYGGGVHRNVGHFTIFGEYARIAGPIQDELIIFGAMYVIH